ncbi:MAG: STAS domain-containing protein [Candidatus Competibacter sp.]|nr:STAS domain-containing protein [Candidatus Competibacter sp.]
MNLIECPSELDIASVGALHQQLLNALQTPEPLEIDGRAIQRIHTAALQLFLGFMSEARLQGLSVNWRNPSPAVVEGARLLGLTDRLGLATTETS